LIRGLPVHRTLVVGPDEKETRMKKVGMLLASAAMAVAGSTATLTIAAAPAHALADGCQSRNAANGDISTVPGGVTEIEAAYTIVVRNGEVYHRHKVYQCNQNRTSGEYSWEYAGSIDRRVDVIGCCPDGGDGDGHEPILT
jgi:hypothetical protein